MNKKVDIGWEGVEISVEGQHVLTIEQTSDDDTINLFFYPNKDASICKSVMSEQDPKAECTHELLVERNK